MEVGISPSSIPKALRRKTSPSHPAYPFSNFLERTLSLSAVLTLADSIVQLEAAALRAAEEVRAGGNTTLAVEERQKSNSKRRFL